MKRMLYICCICLKVNWKIRREKNKKLLFKFSIGSVEILYLRRTLTNNINNIGFRKFFTD